MALSTLVQDFNATFVTEGATNESVVVAMFANIYGTAEADIPAGFVAWWVAQLESGAVTQATIVETSLGFVAAGTLADGDLTTAANAAKAAVDAGEETVAGLKATVEAAIAANPEPETPDANAGETFTLTTGTDSGDDFVGTDQNDTYTADLLTLNNTDVLDGGAGTDTLNAQINSAISNTLKISNIENVTLTALGNQNVALDNITGVTKLTSKDSTGSLTVTKATAAMGYGFEGSATNTISASYIAGQLSGSSDTLNVDLNTAKGVSLTVDSGFETAAINVTGTSDIDTFTTPGVSTVTIAGSGNLDVADGQLDGVATISAKDYTGNLTTGTVNATTGFVDGVQDGAATGTSVLLGSGDDNIGFKGVSTSGSNTIKLGAGNDRLVLDGTDVSYVFGEAGDDQVDAVDVLAETDLIDLGEGTDTLNLASGTNKLVLRGVENLVVDGTGVATVVTVNSADSALAVSVLTDGTANDDVTLADLSAGSTVVINDSAAKDGSVDALTIGYKATEATATIDVNSAVVDGDTDSVTVTKVTDLTLDFAKAVDLGNGDLSVDDTVNLTVVAAKALDLNGIGSAATDALKTVTITGSDAVTTGAIANSDKLETLTVTAADTKALSVGDILAAKELDTVTLSGKSVELGDLGSTTTIDELTALTATAKDGDITLTAGTTQDVIDATAVGTISLSAEKGSIYVVDATGDASLVAAADSTGITVNMTAKTIIGAASNGSSVANVTNTGGNITASLAGTADANVNYTAVTSGVVSLTSTTTGSVDTTITNAGTAGAGETSAIVLGNATSNDENKVTIEGTVDTLNVTGGTGADTLDFTTTNVIAGGTISMGTGTDTVDFTNFASTGANKNAYDGLVINLGSSTLTITNGTASSTVTAGKVAQFDTDATSNTAKVDSVGTTFTLSGVEKVVGTDSADYIVANSTGTTITGGAKADTIVLGAGVDTVKYASRAEAGSSYAGTDTDASKIDLISGFKAGSGNDVIQLGTTANAFGGTLTLATTTAFNVNTTIALTGDYADLAAMMTAANGAVTAAATDANTAQVYLITVAATGDGSDFDDNAAGTYLVINDDTAALTETDTIINVTGIDVTTALAAANFAVV